jgi:hypothetical protein
MISTAGDKPELNGAAGASGTAWQVPSTTL